MPTMSDSSASPIVRELARIEQEGGDGELSTGRGATLRVTSLDRIAFAARGYTKGDVMRYYVTVRGYVLPVVADRPLVLRRFPDGVDGKGFYQHRAERTPAGVRVEPVPTGAEAKMVPFIVGGDLTTLLYTIQSGAISVDPWHGRVGDVGSADYAILDLDPGPRATFGRVVEVAVAVKQALDELGLRAALKSSGATGLHIYVPLPLRTSTGRALALARTVAMRVAGRAPRIATVERSLGDRPADAVYVDYLQNIAGKTVAGAYALRARAGATVSTPLAWEELTAELDPAAFTITTVPERLRRVGDLWRAGMARRNGVRLLRSLVPEGAEDHGVEG